jgi:hypothetical protein
MSEIAGADAGADAGNIPISMWCVSSLDIERGGQTSINKTEIKV